MGNEHFADTDIWKMQQGSTIELKYKERGVKGFSSGTR